MPTIKIVDFTSAQSWAILPLKMVETGTEFIALWRQFVCQVCLHLAIGEKLNLEVKKISSDSESNSFANLSGISDENIMEEDQEDVEESLTHKLTSRVHVTWCFDRAIQMPFLK